MGARRTEELTCRTVRRPPGAQQYQGGVGGDCGGDEREPHEVLHPIETADSAAIQGRITGTHNGPPALPGRSIPATGRPIDLRFAFLIRGENDRISRDDLYLDRADMIQQLGIG